ncbi:hypothetical protein [Sphingobacterium bovistauri]|uniref:Outer membrane protein beta-barrel domain-containing protein n=1 Tax=Sphingobacterium bovistauri TaxID=2781959 RepID=A0ABS7Z6R5_9SPHI|nr:hypothetical protein [Sphingobacterium bovistauri]MCA5005840.1 hypothetical protein [Sphingobacterium bovistauri]
MGLSINAIAINNSSSLMEQDSVRSLPSFRFVPSNYQVQYAGGIGVVSTGFGWDYGKNKRWATDVIVGYVPKYDSERMKLTFTLRQTYTPWAIKLNNNNLTYHPLRTGMFMSTTAGRQFWFSASDKYPSDYYTFSTKLRFNIFVGQDVEYKLPSEKSYFERVRFYYDFHTSDFNFIARVQNSSLRDRNYIGIALGTKFYIRK